MAENSRKSRGDRVLCLDGGGIRGLIEIQILMEIEKALGNGMKIRDCFDWIGGTSTGGILALAIAKGMSLEKCQDVYWKMKDEVFKGMKPYSPTLLENLLKTEFGEDTKMIDLKGPRVIVASVLADRDPAKLHLFRNYDPPGDDPDDTDYGLFPPCARPQDQFVWEAAMATGAAPTYFESFTRFIDGGLMANNPTIDVLAEIHEYNTAHKTTDRPIDVVVSLGTGDEGIEKDCVPTFYHVNSFWSMVMGIFEGPKSAVRLAEIMLKQATGSQRQAVTRARNWCGMMNINYFRFNPDLPEPIALDCKDDKILNGMLEMTVKYLENSKSQDFQKMVEILKNGGNTEQ